MIRQLMSFELKHTPIRQYVFLCVGSLLASYSLWNRRIAISMRQVDYHV
ncbi:hypothetical protein HXA31_18790 [Salipaludibacillus agaradhaerens]|uniref:Uncharacterized protein n=1 Tax=Salipaludibacillus agaradhaerens TaxID=76935 RepID=A0A9Q4G0K4_SALAG|nr:hypothetical protein [Salipaludibacillus agaradhaerens]MCR6097983.1 hypothetical protein [Salipaludibacillus agaradhaerens]MCR6116388.1 hypothetical protein [Salipaludibacillus agaradhaerens]